MLTALEDPGWLLRFVLRSEGLILVQVAKHVALQDLVRFDRLDVVFAHFVELAVELFGLLRDEA
jgi:hypothetical protein